MSISPCSVLAAYFSITPKRSRFETAKDQFGPIDHRRSLQRFPFILDHAVIQYERETP
jgi:hypothetical protein